MSNVNYKEAGVNIDAGNEAVDLIKEKVKMIELLKYKEDLKIDDNLLENIIIKYFSGLNTIYIGDNLEGGSDPRREGIALSGQ